MNNYSYYPTPQLGREIVYVPQIGDARINRSVSVIGIILIIALLFVGMQLFNGNGIIEQDVTWVIGEIDSKGMSHTPVDTGSWLDDIKLWLGKETAAVGMFTSEGIPISAGVKIKKAFESNYIYKIYCFDEDDAFIGCYGEPRSDGEELLPIDFTGAFAKTKFIRIFVYARDGDTFSTRDWKRARNDYTIYIGVIDN